MNTILMKVLQDERNIERNLGTGTFKSLIRLNQKKTLPQEGLNEELGFL